MQSSKRTSVFESLKNYCHHSKEDDFIEVTEWVNGEGHDIVVSNSSGTQRISLTHGEQQLLQVLLNWEPE